MLRNFAIVAATVLIAGAAILISKVVMRPQLEPDQAGIAYVEDENGTVRLAEPMREAKRVELPSSKPKGADATWLTEFELIERSGKLVSSTSLKGQPYVVGFFFSTCPSICVRQNEKMKTLQEKFRGKPVRLVGISCDPEVDRPEKLAEYADRFQADKEQWLFFTGEMDYITRVGSEMFTLGVMRRGHPEKFALVDADGKVYGLYTWSDPAQWQALQRDMEKLISESPKVD